MRYIDHCPQWHCQGIYLHYFYFYFYHLTGFELIPCGGILLLLLLLLLFFYFYCCKNTLILNPALHPVIIPFKHLYLGIKYKYVYILHLHLNGGVQRWQKPPPHQVYKEPPQNLIVDNDLAWLASSTGCMSTTPQAYSAANSPPNTPLLEVYETTFIYA